MLTWKNKIKLKNWIEDSIWFIPLLQCILAIIFAAISWRIDYHYKWELLDYKAVGGMAAIAAIIGAMITFIGFVFSALLMSVQFASSQLTPRILKITLGNITVKIALGFFISTFVFSLIIMARIRQDLVPQFAILIALLLVTISLIFFLYIINYVALSLRPANLINKISLTGKSCLEKMYKNKFNCDKTKPAEDTYPNTMVIKNSLKSAVLLDLNIAGLTSLASQANCRITLLRNVGDYIPIASDLYQIDFDKTKLTEEALFDLTHIDAERNIQSDPAFGIKLLVDIANKALSPGINDPTTAVLVIDQLHLFLRYLADKDLDISNHYDEAGRLRLKIPSLRWETFVSVSIDEIRHFGDNSIQVQRRLRALLNDLISIVPEERKAILEKQLDVLDLAAEKHFDNDYDLPLAKASDLQGIGGGLN